MRYFERCQSAFLFTCLLPPDEIVTEYNGRSEHEVIPDLEGLADRVFLDAGNGTVSTKLSEIRSWSDVPRSALADWREGYKRVAALRKTEHKAMMLRAISRRQQPATA
jgi:hypothetical protein